MELKNKVEPKGNEITILPFNPLNLRHTFCTIMYEAGIDVMTAKFGANNNNGSAEIIPLPEGYLVVP